MNAYLVCSMLVDSTLLDGKYKARILDEYNRYKERLTSLSGHWEKLLPLNIINNYLILLPT